MQEERKRIVKRVKKEYYQPVGSYYRLPKNIYRMVMYTIRSAYIDGATDADKDIRHDFGELTSDPTGNIAVNHLRFHQIRKICEEAWEEIPAEYRKEIYDHIIHEVQYAYFDGAHEKTYGRYMQIYIWHVANKLGYV
jgi:hypothetical protein